MVDGGAESRTIRGRTKRVRGSDARAETANVRTFERTGKVGETNRDDRTDKDRNKTQRLHKRQTKTRDNNVCKYVAYVRVGTDSSGGVSNTKGRRGDRSTTTACLSACS